MSNEITRDEANAFLKELSELTAKYRIKVDGCGCCSSPYISRCEEGDGSYDDLKQEDFDNDWELGISWQTHREREKWAHAGRIRAIDQRFKDNADAGGYWQPWMQPSVDERRRLVDEYREKYPEDKHPPGHKEYVITGGPGKA